MRDVEQRLREIEQRAEKATPGPWEWSQSYELRRRPMWCLHNPQSAAAGRTIGLHTLLWDLDIDAENNPDLQLMAHAREDVPYLLSLLRERERWIPCSERLPEVGVDVQLWSCHGWATIGKRRAYPRSADWTWDNHAKFPSECFTHWKPIAPPEEAQR